jgi:hypothetical protein
MVKSVRSGVLALVSSMIRLVKRRNLFRRMALSCSMILGTRGFRSKQEARQSLDKAQFRNWYDLAETNQSDESADRLERAFVTALLGRHPLCSGFSPAHAEEVKALACLADIDADHGASKKLVARICQ